LAHRFVSEDLQFGMMLLFSYDIFYVTHLCICDVIEKGEVDEDSMNLLIKLID
jgi:hypothetical protein